MLEVLGIHSLLLTVACVLAGILYLGKRQKRHNYPPGPAGLPLLGYLPFLGKHTPTSFSELSKTYGPIISVKIGTKHIVVLNDYECIQEAVVKRGDAFSGRAQLHITQKITQGLGILFRNFDDDFKIQRKFALQTLRGLGLGKRSMEDRITEEIEYFTDSILSKNGESFDCKEALATSVSNVICSVVMGSRFSYDDKVFRGMIDILNNRFRSKKDAVGTFLLLYAPWLRYIPIFSGVYKRLFDDIGYLFETLQKIIDDHKKTLDVENPRDFIDEYLKKMAQDKSDKDSSFKDSQLLQIIRDFFLAGTETSSSTLQWCVLLFAHRPDIQEKIAKEIKNVIGEAVPSMRNKDEMSYTSAFIHEMTRHRTLVPLAVPHQTSNAVSLMGYHIPKDTTVLLNLWAVHHDPQHFENPDEFKPERFLNGNGDFVPDKHVIPFSVGPRHCLGEQLAKMELFLFLTNIVKMFEIVPDSAKPLPDFNTGIFGIAEVAWPFEVSFVQRQ